jgi:Asp-tRNA(Asn)/Glu-tRNA(Gln) amidotransferase A subunit family amidase
VDDALCLLSATAPAGALRTGTCSARELVEAHLERIECTDPLVNAIVTRTPELARLAADEADGRRAQGAGAPARARRAVTPVTEGVGSFPAGDECSLSCHAVAPR